MDFQMKTDPQLSWVSNDSLMIGKIVEKQLPTGHFTSLIWPF